MFTRFGPTLEFIREDQARLWLAKLWRVENDDAAKLVQIMQTHIVDDEKMSWRGYLIIGLGSDVQRALAEDVVRVFGMQRFQGCRGPCVRAFK